MERERAIAEIERLERATTELSGAAGFAALAEAHRRAGDAAKAEQVAREGLRETPDLVAGRVALGLALIDQGRVDEARGELARVLAAVPDHPLARDAEQRVGGARPEAGPFGELEESELEDAFESAEAERDQMLDANHVAAATLRAVDSVGSDAVIGSASTFATETVAGLLEEQGHTDEARSVRRVLEDREADAAPAVAAPAASERVVATLERWLDNLRRRSQ